MIGKHLSHYEIVSAIGKGGMGEVWKAKDTKLGREVAIKTLPEEFAKDADRLARFEREAKLLASLNHPNIAAIYGLEEHEGTRFLVLELVEGPTLEDRIKPGAIPVEESLKLALQIAEALEAAHEKGVIHRDLKPANIKVTDNGKVKVLDFGLAKAFVGEVEEANISQSPTLSMAATQQGVILGTAAYMSPEQAKGRTVDKRADVWAFGAVLYEMLTGRQSFGASDVSEALAAVIRADPDWSALPANLHPRLREVLQRCLEKNLDTRFRDIGDVKTDIKKVLAGPSGVIVELAAKGAPATPPTRLPWVAAVVLGMFISGVTVWTLGPETEVGSVARFAYELPEGMDFRNVSRTVLAISPNGEHFLYNGDGGIYLRSIGELDARLIPGTERGLSNPAFSPDGQAIAYQQGAQLLKIAVGGGAPFVLTEPVSTPFGISWEPDGTILYGQPDGIWRVSENGGTPVQLISTEVGEQVHGPQLLPGGEWVLFSLTSSAGANRWDEAEIVVESLSAGERRVLQRGSDARYVSTGHLIYAFGDVLFALPFDVDSLEVEGGPVSIVQGVRRTNNPGNNSGAAFYGFSDNGTFVYVPGGAESGITRLTWIDADGDAEPIDLPLGDYLHPRVSPDGQWLVVERADGEGADIWIYETAGNTELRRLTEGGGNRFPVWSRNGEYVAFQSDQEGDGGIFWRRADGTGSVDRLTTPEADTRHIPEAWSPTEDLLAFSVMNGNAVELWLLDTEELTVERFGDLQADNPFDTVFSPDGQWIAYTQRRGASISTWVNAVSNPETRYQIGQDEDNAHHPLWTSDGAQLLYFAGALSAAVDIQTQPTFGFGRTLEVPGLGGSNVTPDILLNHDLAPDGRLVSVRSELAVDDPLQTVVVVLNWFEELKERVPIP